MAGTGISCKPLTPTPTADAEEQLEEFVPSEEVRADPGAVTGRVIDADGEPLAGVDVFVQVMATDTGTADIS